MDAPRPDELTSRKRAIDALEQRLRRDDPLLVDRFHDLERRDRRTTLAVFALLAASVVLLALALATVSPVAGGAGVATYLASFAVDRRHRKMLREPLTGERPRWW